MKRHKKRYSVAKTARVFGVSRSGYYAFEGRKTSRHEKDDLELSGQIKQIFEKHRGRYGSPRVWEELKSRGRHVSRKRIERLMRAMGLKAGRRGKRVKTTDSGHKPAAAGNILNRDFHAAYPGEKWVSDITCLRTDSGRLYLLVCNA